MTNVVEYRAFISYSHKDSSWAKWLHRELETYPVSGRLSGTIGSAGPVPKRLFPVYRDRDELRAAAELGPVIREALRQSAFLVVICSPNAVASKWVDDEILAFKEMGKSDRILALIVDGEPNASETAGLPPALECFPRALRFKTDQRGELTNQPTQPIAADARPQGDGRLGAKIKLIAGLLGVSLDAIKRRDDARRARRVFAAVALCSGVIGGASIYAWQRYDRGELYAVSAPDNSTIVVDGLELGARIGGLPLPSGAHDLLAYADHRFERQQRVNVPRQGRSSVRFWLEEGILWSSPQINATLQSARVVAPRGQPPLILASDALGLAAYSAGDGREVWSVPVSKGEQRNVRVFDMGADLGHVAISVYQNETGISEATVVQVSQSPRFQWTWRGPQTRSRRAHGLTALAVQGFGPAAALGVVALDGRLHVLDVQTGWNLSEITLTENEFAAPPTVVQWSRGGEQFATFLGNTSVAGGERIEIATVGLPRGNLIWRGGLASTQRATLREMPNNGAPQLLQWDDASWQLVDVATGRRRSGGTLPGRLSAAPAEVDFGAAGAGFLFQFSEARLGVMAALASGSAPQWTSSAAAGLNAGLRAPGERIWQASNGALIVATDEGLAALSPIDGDVLWTFAGRVRGLMVDDWDQDGRKDIFVSIAGRGMLCLDENGEVQWLLRMTQDDIEPWGLTSSEDGSRRRNILFGRHASIMGVAHGPREVWQSDPATAPIQATPTIALDRDGKSVVISVAPWGNDVSLRALRGRDGLALWEASNNIPPNRGAALADWDGDGRDEVIVLGSPRGEADASLFIHDLSSGRLIQQLNTDISGWLSCTPVVGEFRGRGVRDIVISAFEERSIALIDGQSGLTVWRYSTNGGNLGGVATGDLNGDGLADVVAGSMDGNIYALNGRNGALLWKQPVDGGAWSTPLILSLDADGPQVVTTSLTGRLNIFRGNNGERLWSPELPNSGPVHGHAAIARLGTRTLILAPSGAAGLIVYDWGERRELWRSFPEIGGLLVTPAITRAALGGEPAVVMATANGDLFLLRLSDGAPLWRRPSDGHPFAADPAIQDFDGDGTPDILAASTRTIHVISGAGFLLPN